MPKDKRGAGPGRPRLVELDRQIRDTALQLLRTEGPGAVSIDAVAARSGVYRSTIYRRYRSRDELIAALLDELVETALPAPTLPVAEKLHWLLRSISKVLEDGIGRGGTSALLTNNDPAFTNALRERMAGRLRVLEEAMTVDIEAGRLSPRVDPDTLVGLLFGAYLSEVLRYGEPRPNWADRTVELLASAVATE